MSDHLLLAPALPAHRVHAVKGPVSEALACVKHTYCSNGSKDVLVAIVIVVLLLFLVLIPAMVASSRRRQPNY